MQPHRAGYRRHLPSSPFRPPEEPLPAEAFTEHERVSHDRYCLGRIALVAGVTAAVVDFGDARVRIPSPFKQLTKL